MSTVFIAPKAFAVVAASQQTQAPASNMLNDIPGRVWRSNGLSGVYTVIQLDGSAWDSIALVGNNLRASDTIGIRAGASEAIVGGSTGLTVSESFAAWTGTNMGNTAISFKLLASPVTSPFVRIDITSTGNPAGYVQAQRLVVGKRVTTDGIDTGAEQGWDSGSVVEELPGATAVQPYATRMTWKVTLDKISNATYQTGFAPLIRQVGTHAGFVFIPDDESTYLQNDAMFCRMTSSAKGSSPVSDYNILELSMKSIS